MPPKARPGLRRLREGLARLGAPSMRQAPSEMISFVLEEAGYREVLKIR